MLIAICGPIASGKSTLARAVAGLFVRHGTEAAAVDLDLVYEMLEPGAAAKENAATWGRARRAAGALADALLQDGVGVVVVEGDFLTAEQRNELTTALRSSAPALFVTLRVPIDVALERVQRDPTRGLSRDPGFLRRHYARVEEDVRGRPATDLVIDTASVGVDEAARTVVAWASGRVA